MDNLNNIWNMAELALEEKIMADKCTEIESLSNNSINSSPRKNVFEKCDHVLNVEGCCEKCGGVITYNINREGEWNNYKDDVGNYSKNTQRGDVYVDNNPYSRGGTLINGKGNSLMYKLQVQNTFSHKQKTYWQITTEIDHIADILKLNNKSVIDTAKNYWHKYMESGKLTRASVRKGLIAACLYYSCIQNSCPIERHEILKAFDCDTKTLSKGEKVLFEILNSKNLTYVNSQIEESNSFIRYCSLLKLEFFVSSLCNEIYEKHKIQLQAVTPKSSVGGIIAYVVKYKLSRKMPTKTIISATVDVCTPTLNKVIQLICNLENLEN